MRYSPVFFGIALGIQLHGALGAAVVKPVPQAPGEKQSKQQAEHGQESRASSDKNVARGDFTIDEIKAVVSGPVKDDIITLSDVERRGFTGEKNITVDKIVQERLADQRGEKMHYAITNEDVERQIKSMSPTGEFDRAQIEAIAKQWGFTMDEFYDELKRLYRSVNVVSQELQSKVEVTDSEARHYYAEHPEPVEGKYLLQVLMVPESVEDPLRYGNKAPKELWGEEIPVAFSELPEDKEFVKTMAAGEIRSYKAPTGVHLYKLIAVVEPSVVPFEKRKAEIVTALKQEKMNVAMAQQEQEKNAGCAVFYPRTLQSIAQELAEPSAA